MEIFLIMAAAAFVVIFFFRLLGKAIKPIVWNIIAGGALYWFLDAFDILKMDWSVFDAIVVAVFGAVGTIFLAVLKFF